MKFGIFDEHQMGRPWDDGTEYELIQDALPRQWVDATKGAALGDQLKKFADDRAEGRRDATVGIAGRGA